MIIESLPWWETAVRIVRKRALLGDYKLRIGEELVYRVIEWLDEIFWRLDEKIRFFPSVLKTLLWNEIFVYGLMMVPILIAGVWLIAKTKNRKIKMVVAIICLWLVVPVRGLGQEGWKKIMEKTGLDYKIARSNQMVWMWTTENEVRPYSLFEYKWEQKSGCKSAKILVSNLGHYRLMVNGEAVYDGPNFGTNFNVFYDEIKIEKYIKKGENEIRIIANFVDEEMHGYERYGEPRLLVGGWIRDGLRFHNLSDSQKWRGGGVDQIENSERVSADAGYQIKADFRDGEIGKNLKAVKRIERGKYKEKANPLPLLGYEKVELTKRDDYYDLGRFSTGYVEIRKKDESECEMRLSWRVEKKETEYFNQSDEYKLPKGEFEWRGLNRRGGRYIKMEGNCGETAISFWRVKADLVEADGAEKLLEIDRQIYKMCVNTIKNNVQNQIEDCVERERAMYVGDAREVSRCLMVDGENMNYVKEMIRKMAEAQRSNGAIPAMAPSGDDMLIPGYSLQWVVWLNDYVTESGDAKFFRQMEKRLRGVMEWAKRNEADEGFLERKEIDDWWNFTDWTPLAEGYRWSTGLQIWYYRALRATEELYEKADSEESEYYRNKADRLRDGLRKMVIDKKTGVFGDSFDQEKMTMGTVVINGLAGVSGLFESEQESIKAIEYFRKSGWITDSPYSQSWVIEWMIESKMELEAVETIRQYWGGMIDRGATSVWEVFRPGQKEETAGSRSHAWGCGPIYLYKEIGERMNGDEWPI